MLIFLHLFTFIILATGSAVSNQQFKKFLWDETQAKSKGDSYPKPVTHRRGFNIGGSYNGASHNWQAGVGLDHKSGGNTYGLGANYNSAGGGLNIGANANFHNNVNVGAGYNTGSKAFGASVGINFRRRLSPTTKRYDNTEACVGRMILQEDIQRLHKTVGSRHVELLKVNLSDSVDLKTYSAEDLVQDLKFLQKKVAELFPQICNFILKLTKDAPCTPLASDEPSEINQEIPWSSSDWTDLKLFTAKLIYGEKTVKNFLMMEKRKR